MENLGISERRRRLSWGLVLILAGAVAYLQLAGLLPEPLGNALFCFQSIFLAIGVAKLIQGELWHSLIWIGVGILSNYHAWSELVKTQLLNVGIDSSGFSAVFWPVVLVGLGLIVIFVKPSRNRCHQHVCGTKFSQKYGNTEQTTDTDGRINYRFVFSGSEQVFMEPVFRGGNISATCGGIELDLRHTTLPEGDTILNIDATMGGFKLKVPSNWKVVNQCSFVMGGISDERFATDIDTTRQLIITGRCVLGGGAIE